MIRVSARERFVMLELGAGYGRWGILGTLAARMVGIEDVRVRLIEAEPQHAAWAAESIRLNGLEREVSLIEAAIWNQPGLVPFAIDVPSENLDAASWYGQNVMTWDSRPQAPTGESYFGKPVYRNVEVGQVYVPTITLEEATEGLDRIDLIDSDTQGAEIELLPWMDLLTTKVKAVHIETHTPEIEVALREEFGRQGWSCRWDFPIGERETQFGRIYFQGGVQAWLNPSLDGPA